MRANLCQPVAVLQALNFNSRPRMRANLNALLESGGEIIISTPAFA